MKHEDEGPDRALRAVAERLGRAAAARVDVERTAARVVAQLRADAQRERRLRVWLRSTGLRIAAALVIVVGAGVVVARGPFRPGGRRAVPAEATGGELGELSAEQLRQLLTAVDRPATDADVVLVQEVGLEDLSASQLQALLASFEGAEGTEG